MDGLPAMAEGLYMNNNDATKDRKEDQRVGAQLLCFF